MRNEKFEEELISLQAKIHQRIKKIKGAELQQLVVSGLGSKCLSHCEMALSLVQSGALAEAIIVLRAAYEAGIRGLYLNANPDNIPAYEAYSSITTLRNQLEVLQLLDEFDEPYEGKELQEKLIAEQKKKILDKGYHKIFKIKEEALNNCDSMKSKTNRPNMPSFEEIRQSLDKSSSLVKALLTTGFQVYNVGSQMAHSSFEMMTSMVYFDMKHPLYSEHAAYQQILLLLLCSCHCFAACGVMSMEDFEALRTEYEKACRGAGIVESIAV